MDPDSTLISLITLIVLILFSAFFSSSETALTSYNRIKLKHLVEKKNKRAILIDKLLQEPDKLLTTILIGNNIVNVLICVMATSLALSLYGEKVLVLLSFVLTFILLVFAEITPKSIAATYPEKISSLVVYPIYFCMIIFHFFIKIMTIFTRSIKKLISKKMKDQNKNRLFTVEEFQTMIKVGEKEGIFAKNEIQMLNGFMKFKNGKVKEILKTPRINIVGIPLDATYEEVKKIISSEEFSRYPVYLDSLDNIVGILYAKDLLKLSQSDIQSFHVENFMKKKEEIIFVPESMNVNQLFSDMKKRKIHMAIVFDEYGGTKGLISMEDLLEVIVGEIQDETDTTEEQHIIEINEKYVILQSQTKISELNQKLNISLPNEDFETVGGFIAYELKKIPSKGETLLWNDFKFTIINNDNHRSFLIKLEKVLDKK